MSDYDIQDTLYMYTMVIFSMILGTNAYVLHIVGYNPAAKSLLVFAIVAIVMSLAPYAQSWYNNHRSLS